MFCVNVKHTEEMEQLLNGVGIPARAISRKSKDHQGIMRDFRDGKIRFLCSCLYLTVIFTVTTLVYAAFQFLVAATHALSLMV